VVFALFTDQRNLPINAGSDSILIPYYTNSVIGYFMTNCVKYFRHMTAGVHNPIFYFIGLLIFSD
jgi:hypothetical protein